MAGTFGNFGKPGVAAGENGLAFSTPALTIQDTPALGGTRSYNTETAIPARTPVALASGLLVPITYDDMAMAGEEFDGVLVGVTAFDITAATLTADGGESPVDVYTSGYFNYSALNFDATVDSFAIAQQLFDTGGDNLQIGRNLYDEANAAEAAS